MVYIFICYFFFFFKLRMSFEWRIGDWSSDVCSSDLEHVARILADKARLKGSDAAFVPRIRHDDNARDQPEIVDQFVEKLLPAVRPQGCIKRHGHEFHKLAVDHRTEERRVGKRCVSTGRYRWEPCN